MTNVGLSGIAGQYDRDDNETIDRDEAIAAVADYFSDTIGREETLAARPRNTVGECLGV